MKENLWTTGPHLGKEENMEGNNIPQIEITETINVREARKRYMAYLERLNKLAKKQAEKAKEEN